MLSSIILFFFLSVPPDSVLELGLFVSSRIDYVKLRQKDHLASTQVSFCQEAYSSFECKGQKLSPRGYLDSVYRRRIRDGERCLSVKEEEG